MFTQDLEDLEAAEAEAAEANAGQPADQKPNGSQQAAATKSNGNGDGKKKATPIHIRDLNMALTDAKVGHAEADKRSLKGREREDFVVAARMEWVNKALGTTPEGQIPSMTELLADEAEKLIKLAKDLVGKEIT